jgi:hypothetical protein
MAAADRCFPKASFHATKVDKIIKTDRIDNSLCPYATLPNDWNSYLDQLSTNTRRKIRRLLKQIETSSAPPVRKWRRVPDRQTASEHPVPA